MLWLVALLIQRLLGYLMWPGCLVNTDFPHTHTHIRGEKGHVYTSRAHQERLSKGCREELTQQLCERLKRAPSSLFSSLFIHTVSCQSESNTYVCIENKALDCFSRIREGRLEMEMKSLASVAWGLYAHLVQLNSFQWCNCKTRIDDKTFWWHNSAANTGHVTLEIRGNMIP